VLTLEAELAEDGGDECAVEGFQDALYAIEVNEDALDGSIALSQVGALDEAGVLDVPVLVYLIDNLLNVEVHVTLVGIEEFGHLHGGNRHEFKRCHEVWVVVRIVTFDLLILPDIVKDLGVLELH
jgi:hypothetical protein